jgi:cysteine-rich repeat protein
LSLGMLLALAAGGGCTSIVGLDDVGFTGTGGTSATGGGGAGTTSSTTSAGGHGGDTTSSSMSSGGDGGTTSSSSSGTTTTMPMIVCGDGDIDYPEQCEDGNTMNGDGCSSECLVEPFYQCEGGAENPSVCTKHEVICNDGLDNDGDGGKDADDSDCALPSSFLPCEGGQKLHVYKPVDVPDNFVNEARSSVFVADDPIIIRAAVTFTVTHPAVSLLEGDLTRLPNGKIDLFTQLNVTGANFTATVLDSTCAAGIATGMPPFAGCYKPEEPFSFLANGNGHGEWELEIKDDTESSFGTLEDWALILCVQ